MDTENNNSNAVHCVYISFDNKDSSISSFIDYLKATFNRHGINQLDEQSDRFAEIRVLVVVFSKNYTFSAPETLVNYLNQKALVVVPVLHGVTVSSVKQQIAVLDQMSMWPRVLPCHVYNEERSGPEFMDVIARNVFEELYPTEEIGIHRLQKKMEDLLCEQPWGVRTLGIFGEPGIGKTTLATAVFRHMSGGYDASCLIKDFHTKYNDKRLESLPPEYLSKTLMEKFDLNSFDSEPRYRKKRVLIALDDVRNARDATSFLGGFDKFGPGSLIIITSRNEQILEECQMNAIYELKGLDDQDALKLFTRCAFGNNVIEENLLEISKKEIKSYDGNPYVIRSKAKEFKSKTMVEMESALTDVFDILISGHDVSSDIEENKYEEYGEAQENKEFPSDYSSVLATRDTETIILTPSVLCAEHELQSYFQKNLRSGLYSRLSKSLPSNLKVYRLDYNSVIRSLSEHLYRKHNILLQGLSSQLQKLSQSFSNSRDHDLLEQNLQRLLILSGGCDRIKLFLDAVRKHRELNRKGLYGRREKRSGTTELLKIKTELDQANGMGQYMSK